MGKVLGHGLYSAAFVVGFAWGIEHGLWQRLVRRPLRELAGF